MSNEENAPSYSKVASVRISCGIQSTSWMTVAIVPFTPTGQPALMIATEGKPCEITPAGQDTSADLVCSAVMLFGESALDELEEKIKAARALMRLMKVAVDEPRTVQ